MLIKENYEDVLEYDGNDLVNINDEELLNLLIKDNHKQEYMEIVDILGNSK